VCQQFHEIAQIEVIYLRQNWRDFLELLSKTSLNQILAKIADQLLQKHLRNLPRQVGKELFIQEVSDRESGEVEKPGF
jgi:hypothetical protein